MTRAAHGANRTGRMFTGDGTDAMGSGSFLMRALFETGFANQPTSVHPDDGLELRGLSIGASVRCAPPENKPLPSEIDNCRPYLLEELDLLGDLRVVVALGRLAFDQVLDVGAGTPILLGSYHPSRQNTQTGVLKPDMLRAIFETARHLAFD